MLKGNLSTRPFYNDRVVTVVLAVFGLLVFALTLVNAARLVTLSRERAEVRARAAANIEEAARVRAQADEVRRSVDRDTLTRLAASAVEANELIDRRTFSWTHLLAQLERTLPADVRLTEISPRIERNVFRIAMAVVARDLDDVDVFIDELRATGQFYDVAPTEQRLVDDGTYRAVIEAGYLSPRATVAGAP